MAVTLCERQTGVDRSSGHDAAARHQLMEKFVIDGGVPLSGTMVPAGNKNGALAILAACVLTTEEVVLGNVPRIRDVEAMLAILARDRRAVEWSGANELSLCAAGVHDVEIEAELAELIRASFLLAGPLLARFGGGDAAPGRRRDRQTSPRPASRRVPRDGCERAVRARDRAERAAGACAPPRCSWTSRR